MQGEKLSEKIKKTCIAIIVFLALSSITLASFMFYYYGLKGTARAISEKIAGEEKEVNVPLFSAAEEKSYISAASQQAGAGDKAAVVVFDAAHKNDYNKDEINALLKELGAKSIAFEFLNSKENLPKVLRYATAFVIISPAEEYEKGETEEIKSFIAKGGKIALFAEPTRKQGITGINSISSALGITFEQDYLYNLKENAGNFRYIIVKDFARNEITKELNMLVFYVACPISSSYASAYVDENTKSASMLGSRLSPLSFVPDSVLAVCDQSFMQPQYSAALDNAKLISNIAGFVGKSKRAFYLEDFPYMFGQNARIGYTNGSALEKVLRLKNILRAQGIDAEIEKRLDGNDKEKGIFTGFYSDLNASGETKGVELGIFEKEKIKLNNIELDKNLTSIIYSENGRIWILGNSGDELNELLDIIEKAEIDKYLLTKNLAAVIHKPKIEKIEKREELPQGHPEVNKTSPGL